MASAVTAPFVAALLRWIAFGAAALVVGVVAFEWIHRSTPHPHSAALTRLARRSAMALLVTAILRLGQQSLAFATDTASVGAMALTLLRTPWGYAWLLQLFAATCLALRPSLLLRRGSTDVLLPVVLALAIVLPPAFQGHAFGSAELVANAVVADAMHLVASGVWIGTLAVLVIVALPAADVGSASLMIRAFSPYALVSAATLAMTGSFAAWLHINELPLVWGSAYGRVLCFKIALVCVVLALGAFNWKRMTPRLAEPGGVASLARSARWEVLVAVAVMLATAVLVATPLPGE